jgi:hypothetical protein
MNRRKKILGLSIGSLAAVFAGIYGLQVVFINPLKDLDRQAQAQRDRLHQINDERRAYFTAEDSLKSVVQRSFGRDADTASAEAGKMISDQIVRLGLQESEFSRLPVGPRKFRGAQEVGWSVQGEGPLAKMLDLLFVLEQTPQVHRLEGLVISAGDRPGRVKTRFRYLTLVVDVILDVPKKELPLPCTLDSPQRRYYDAIVQRDLLRPYVPRTDAPATADPAADSDIENARPEMVKVVSLSEWQGVPEVQVCNLNNQKLARFKPGDDFLGGQIVRVDYRALPLPGKPELLSYSRVIVKIGSEYWAVEQGQTLDTKYQMAAEQLPPDLPKF